VGRLAVISGTGLRGSEYEASLAPVDFDGVRFLDAGTHLVLPRHGVEQFRRPHEIDHRAHVRALQTAGDDRVLGLSSVGSLRIDWDVGTTVCPDDFYAPQLTISMFDDGRSHGIPGFDGAWRAHVLDAWRQRAESPLVDGGTYAHVPGPRFETPAEVRALARVADLVGMTVAAECILTREAGVAYAAVCTVDNLANGLAPTLLTIDEFRAGVAANRARLLADLAAVLPSLVGAS
jgi:5'-methylthioadenosine phosphorylase